MGNGSALVLAKISVIDRFKKLNRAATDCPVSSDASRCLAVASTRHIRGGLLACVYQPATICETPVRVKLRTTRSHRPSLIRQRTRASWPSHFASAR